MCFDEIENSSLKYFYGNKKILKNASWMKRYMMLFIKDDWGIKMVIILVEKIWKKNKSIE